LTRAAVGGAAASAAGGKFANGAFTAAFNYLLNDSNPAHENSDEEGIEQIMRHQARVASAAKKVGDGAAATGEVIADGYKEVVIGKGIGVGAALGKGAARTIISRIKESSRLVKEAEVAGKSAQGSMDRMVEQLKSGNMNPGIGTKNIGDGIFETRAADGGRVYFRNTTAGIEILGKSTKANQDAVIKEIKHTFGK
jgi:putative component of toxin-antitoxin plasmid stabilization module